MKELYDYKNQLISLDVAFDVFYKLKNTKKYVCLKEMNFWFKIMKNTPQFFLQDFPTFRSFCEVLKIKGWSII